MSFSEEANGDGIWLSHEDWFANLGDWLNCATAIEFNATEPAIASIMLRIVSYPQKQEKNEMQNESDRFAAKSKPSPGTLKQANPILGNVDYQELG